MKKKQLPAARRFQKILWKSAATVSGSASTVLKKTSGQLRILDEELSLSATVREKGGQLRAVVAEVNQEYGVSEKATAIGHETSAWVGKGKDAVGRVSDNIGLYKAANQAIEVTKKYQLDKRLELIGRSCEELYGGSRGIIKPYFPPETPDELLRNTRAELAYISACIMQISPGEAEKLATQFGTVVASKIAGVAASGALLSLVSTFGTAGTGTAIVSLSGAASTSATLAWVGGLLGGGMATGAVLTGGVSIVVGLSAYKALSSERREFDDLNEIEQRIVQYCWMLIAIIDDYAEKEYAEFSVDDAYTLLNDTLLPLQSLLKDNSDSICRSLDNKNAVAYRQHVLRDFGPAIIDPFSEYIVSGFAEKALHYEYVIGGVIYALLTKTAVDDSLESQLVLAALRRSDSDLVNASEAELSRYLDSYNAEQLKGIAYNVKGIYHEQLWVEQYNAANEATRAELFGTINHAGSDVRIVQLESGDVIAEYQLKATDNVAYVNEHIIRYPHIEVIVTDEVAAKIDGVRASGNFNADLNETVESDIDALSGNALDDRVLEGVGLAATIATGRELIEMLQGSREFPEAVTKVVKKAGTAGASTAIAAYLFS